MHIPVDSNRCCAVLCDFPNNVKILMFNMYVPCDTDNDQANLELYIDVLSKRSHIRSNYLDVNHTIIAGDLNTEMTRRNSLHTIAFEEYLKNEGLLLCSSCTDDEVLITYMNEFTGSRSKLDHLIISECLSSEVCHYYSIHKGVVYQITIPL